MPSNIFIGMIFILQNYMRKIFCFFISLLLFSCAEKSVKNKYYGKFDNNCSIQILGKKDIIIDENFSPTSMYIQYIDHTNELSIYNAHDNSVYFFDYDQGIMSRKKQFSLEGSKGVGLIQGYDYVNEDSLFVYNVNTEFVCLLNSHLEIIWKRRLNIDELQSMDFIPSFPYLQTNSPMKYISHKLVFGGMGTAETTAETSTNRPVTTIYDFQEDSVKFANNYPEQYQKYNWGGGFYRMPYFDVNEEENNMIISFPQDHYLYVYSLQNNMQSKYYAGSNLIKEIKAYDEKKDLRTNNNEDRVRDWFFSIPTYRSILYDKYRNLYYRFACLPKTEKLRKYVSGTQPVIVIVLYKDFNYLGEGMLPDDIDMRYTNSFVTKDGLNIQVVNDNEDLMTFYQFKIEINE